MGISQVLRKLPLEAGYSFERILVLLDGSGSADRILPTVRALCSGRSSHLVLARIIGPELPGPGTPSMQDTLRLAELHLRQASLAIMNPDIEVKTVVYVGSTAETLLTIAAEEEASLIAMSMRGEPIPEEGPFGTLSEQLLLTSPVPILAFPAHAATQNGERLGRPFRTLLIPFRGNEPELGIIPVALNFAEAFGVDLAVLLWIASPASTGRGEAERLVYAEEQLWKLASPFESKGIGTAYVVKDGDPASAILDVAQDRKADLITMSTAGIEGRRPLIQAVSEGSTLPVLLSSFRSAKPEGLSP